MADKKEYITYLGILTLLIVSGGVGYYIQDADSKTGCWSGWEQINDTHWGCTTSSGVREEVCFDVWDSANTENYWCGKGNIILTEDPYIEKNETITEKDDVNREFINGEEYLVIEQDGKEFRCVSPNGLCKMII